MTFENLQYTAKTHTTGGREGASRSSDGRLDIVLSARKMKVALPAGTAIDEVGLGTTGDACFIGARLNLSLPGLDRDVGEALVAAAHLTCPYSKATRGNIDVVVRLV